MIALMEAIFTGVIVGVIVAVASAVLNRRIIKAMELRHEDAKKQQVTNDAMVSGVKSLLHDSLYHGLERAYFRGVVGYDEFDNLSHLYDPYVELGGNGTAKRRYEQVDLLPRVHDDDLKHYSEEGDINDTKKD